MRSPNTLRLEARSRPQQPRCHSSQAQRSSTARAVQALKSHQATARRPRGRGTSRDNSTTHTRRRSMAVSRLKKSMTSPASSAEAGGAQESSKRRLNSPASKFITAVYMSFASWRRSSGSFAGDVALSPIAQLPKGRAPLTLPQRSLETRDSYEGPFKEWRHLFKGHGDRPRHTSPELIRPLKAQLHHIASHHP